MSKNVKMSPRKVRLVAKSVKGAPTTQALILLSQIQRGASLPLKKAIESALANAVHNFKAKKESLAIKHIIVGEGVSYRRYHYAARGRIRPYKKRSSHIRVILEDKTERKEENPK